MQAVTMEDQHNAVQKYKVISPMVFNQTIVHGFAPIGFTRHNGGDRFSGI